MKFAFFRSVAAVVCPNAFIWGAPEPTGQVLLWKRNQPPAFFGKQDTDSSPWNQGSKENVKFNSCCLVSLEKAHMLPWGLHSLSLDSKKPGCLEEKGRGVDTWCHTQKQNKTKRYCLHLPGYYSLELADGCLHGCLYSSLPIRKLNRCIDVFSCVTLLLRLHDKSKCGFHGGENSALWSTWNKPWRVLFPCWH